MKCLGYEYGSCHHNFSSLEVHCSLMEDFMGIKIATNVERIDRGLVEFQVREKYYEFSKIEEGGWEGKNEDITEG